MMNQKDVEDDAKPVLGMALSEITDELRDEEQIANDVNGVFVIEVLDGTNAADKGIKAGDVIVEVNQEAVKTPGDVSKRIAELSDDGRKNALLMVSSKDGDIRFVVLRIEG